MAETMNFPNDWAEFLEDYSFRDHKEFYTNGARLIPTFRVEQMMHHYLRKAVTDNNVGSKWIPVTERLPENNTRVVVCYNNPIDGEKTVSSDVFWKGHWVRFGETVTHWMPLPEPPKGE